MKKKIFAIVLCVAMLAIALVGGTMAYFTDTHAQTNTFTAGKVDIALFESVVEKVTDAEAENLGDLVATDETTTEAQNYHLFPGMTVTKNPTIRVEADSEDAYIGAIVTITGDVYDLMPVADAKNLDISKLASGGLMAQSSNMVQGWNGLPLVHENDECVIYQDASKADENVWTMYIFVKEAKAANAEIVLFDTLTIPAEWDNEKMALINGMEIAVAAYATQTSGFENCFEALTTAFSTDFGF